MGRALANDLVTFTSQRKAMLKVLNALVMSNNRAELLRSAEQLNEAQYKEEFEERLDVPAVDEVVDLQHERPRQRSRNARKMSLMTVHRRGSLLFAASSRAGRAGRAAGQRARSEVAAL